MIKKKKKRRHHEDRKQKQNHQEIQDNNHAPTIEKNEKKTNMKTKAHQQASALRQGRHRVPGLGPKQQPTHRIGNLGARLRANPYFHNYNPGNAFSFTI